MTASRAPRREPKKPPAHATKKWIATNTNDPAAPSAPAVLVNPQVVWCEFGEHTYRREFRDDWPPYACPPCADKLPTLDELAALQQNDSARAKRLRASAGAAYSGPSAEFVCAGCERPIALPADAVPVCRPCRTVGFPTRRPPADSIQLGQPFAAAREIGHAIAQSDIDWLERRAVERHDIPQETLWCEAGAHEWLYPKIPGRRPRSCPAHATDVQGRFSDWPGNVADCFLLNGKWSVRIYVDAPLIRGSTWNVPLAIATGLQLEPERRLDPRRAELGQTLTVRARPSGGARGGSLSTALQAVGAIEGDFLFVTLQATRYDLVARRKREVAPHDALGKLLWGCGLDPEDSDARDRPWAAVSRAIGGGNATREEVRSRLIERKNLDLLASLDGTRAPRRSTARPESDWIVGWEFTSPLTSDDSMFALENGHGTIRIALGFPDLDANDPGLLVDSTGVTWVERRQEQERLNLPAELPSERWVRWKRAEHHASCCALAGGRWRIVPVAAGWRTDDGQVFVTLVDALSSIAHESDWTAGAPAVSTHATSPRSAFAYERLVTRALNRGLAEIAANADEGLAATFPEGVHVAGPTLADLFS